MDRALAQHISGHLVYDCRYDPEFLQVAVACCHSEEDAMLIARSVQPFLSKAPMTQFSARLLLVMCARQFRGLTFALSVIKAYGSTIGDECRAFRELLHVIARSCRNVEDLQQLHSAMRTSYADAGFELPSILHLAVLSGQTGLARRSLVTAHRNSGFVQPAISSLRDWSTSPSWRSMLGTALPALCTAQGNGKRMCVFRTGGEASQQRTEWPTDSWSSPCISCMSLCALQGGSKEERKERLDVAREHLQREAHAENHQLLMLQNVVDRALQLATCCSLGYMQLGDPSAARSCLRIAHSLVLSLPAADRTAKSAVDISPTTMVALTAATLLIGKDRFLSSLTVLRLYSALLSARSRPAAWASALELSMLLSPTMAEGLTPQQVKVVQAQVVTLFCRVEQAVSLPMDMLERDVSSIRPAHASRDMAGRQAARVMSIYGDISIEAAVEAVEAYARADKETALASHAVPSSPTEHVTGADLEDVASRLLSGSPTQLPHVTALAVTPNLYVNSTASTGQSKAAPAPGSVHIFDDIVLEPRDDVTLDTLLEVRARLQMRGGLAVDTAAEEELPKEIRERNPYAIANDVVGLELLSYLSRLPSSPVAHILPILPSSVSTASTLEQRAKATTGGKKPHSITSLMVHNIRMGTGDGPRKDDFDLNEALPGRPLSMVLRTAALSADLRLLEEAKKVSQEVMAELEAKIEEQSSSSSSDTDGEGEEPAMDTFQSLHLLIEQGAVMDVTAAVLQAKRMRQGTPIRVWMTSDSRIESISKSAAVLSDILTLSAHIQRNLVTQATLAQATIMQAAVMDIGEEKLKAAHKAIDKVQRHVLTLSASPTGSTPAEPQSERSAVLEAWRSSLPLFPSTSMLAQCPQELIPGPPGAYFLPKALMATATGRALHHIIVSRVNGLFEEAEGGRAAVSSANRPVMCAGGRPAPSEWSKSLQVMERTIKALEEMAMDVRSTSESVLQRAKQFDGLLTRLTRQAQRASKAHAPVEAMDVYATYLNLLFQRAERESLIAESAPFMDFILGCLANEVLRAFTLERHLLRVAAEKEKEGGQELKARLIAALQRILPPRFARSEEDAEARVGRESISLHWLKGSVHVVQGRDRYQVLHPATQQMPYDDRRTLWLAFATDSPAPEGSSTVDPVPDGLFALCRIRSATVKHVRGLSKETEALMRGDAQLRHRALNERRARWSNAVSWLHVLLEVAGDAAMLGIPLTPWAVEQVVHAARQAAHVDDRLSASVSYQLNTASKRRPARKTPAAEEGRTA